MNKKDCIKKKPKKMANFFFEEIKQKYLNKSEFLFDLKKKLNYFLFRISEFF